ncbi:hypothetical protein V8E52_010993 [Russula decolorans]
MASLAQIFKDCRDEKEVQSDILQVSPSLSVTDALSDSFINTTAGWINLLLLSSSILAGKAKLMFARLANSETDLAMSREPTEMSRPTTTTRSGVPGCSIPASGRGALSIAREVQSKYRPLVLDIGYRARQIGDWQAFVQEQLEAKACLQEKEVLATYDMLMQRSESADPPFIPPHCTCSRKRLVGYSKGGAASVADGGRVSSSRSRTVQFLARLDGISTGVTLSGTALVVHPHYVLSAAPPSVYEPYKAGHEERYLKSYKAMRSIELETPVLLNSLVRASPDKKTGSYRQNLANVKAIEETLNVSRSTAGVGVDQELIPSVPTEKHTFISCNFTDAEIACLNGSGSIISVLR